LHQQLKTKVNPADSLNRERDAMKLGLGRSDRAATWTPDEPSGANGVTDPKTFSWPVFLSEELKEIQ